MKSILWGMIRKNRIAIILFLLFCCIFAAVFSLYSLPAEAVAYALLLCAVLGCLAGVPAFLAYRKKHGVLRGLQQQQYPELDRLPHPSDTLEADYQALVKSIEASRLQLLAQTADSQTEMNDYYTMWAHQIKTPIAAMDLMLQSGNADDEAMRAELFSIEQYVDMVLHYLRMESMSQDLLLKPYPIDRIIKRSLRKYSRLFIYKKLTLEYQDIDKQVLTDEKWLGFALDQLLSNALKYTNTGGISIHMDGETLVIEDTGIGIRSEDLPRVFQRGFTGYNGRAERKSTGIGLYLCKQILDKLGHGVELVSQPGVGTQARINLARRRLEVE